MWRELVSHSIRHGPARAMYMYSVTVMAGLLADQLACFTTVLCYAYAAIQSHAEKKAFSHMLVYTTPKRPMG